MNEVIIATEITALCADGTVHDNVTMKIVGEIVLFETIDKQYLCNASKVIQMQSGKATVDPLLFSIFNNKYRLQEQGK